MCAPDTVRPRRRRSAARAGHGPRRLRGTAPKFPPSALLEALLRNYERTGSAAALQAVARTGNAMARGGIYDQLAGGFARYSVDNAWVVPHFEKMLYDNALLLRAYAHWARRTGDPLARRVTAQTARFLLDELADGDMFTSSLDADADGREGSTYVWTPAQLTEVLGADDGRWAADGFRRSPRSGTFEHGTSVLQLLADPDDPQRAGTDPRRVAGRPAHPGPARTRRQGRHVLERAGDHRAGRSQCRLGGTRVWRTPHSDARPRCWTCTSSTAGCGAPAWAGWSATAPRSWRTTRCWPPDCWRCTS